MQNSSHPEPTHIERGNYIADVLQGSTAYPFWYYIIQRKGSKELIDLVKFDSYEQAIANAQGIVGEAQSGSNNRVGASEREEGNHGDKRQVPDMRSFDEEAQH